MYGLSISKADTEKFQIRKGEAGPRFFAIVWLIVSKSQNAAGQ
jgi:hypothetical protein